MNLSNRKIMNMKKLKINISQIIKNEYRKRYFYSIKYYYISKINPILSNSKFTSTFIYRFREYKYEYDEKNYLILLNYDSSIIKNMLKMIISINPNYCLHKFFPNYFCFEGEYFNIFQNYIKEKKIFYNRYILKKNKSQYNNNTSDNDNIKDNENSIIRLINDINDNKNESKYDNINNDKEEKNKENTSTKSLIFLIKKICRNTYRYKYNKIKESFLENNNINYNSYSNKYNNNNINIQRKLTVRKRSSLPEFPLINFKNRVLRIKTEKNLFKFLGGKPLVVDFENKKIIKRKKNIEKTKTLKSIKSENKNSKFLPVSYFENKIKEKKEKIQNLNNIFKNCEININFDKNKNKNEIIINGNSINILRNKEDILLMKNHCSKKCLKALNYDELTNYGIMSNYKKIIKTELVNKISKLSSHNIFNIKLFCNIDNDSRFSYINKRNNIKKTLTKSLSNTHYNKYLLKNNNIYDFKRDNKRKLKTFFNSLNNK